MNRGWSPEGLDAGVAEYFSWDHREDDPRQIVEAILSAALAPRYERVLLVQVQSTWPGAGGGGRGN